MAKAELFRGPFAHCSRDSAPSRCVAARATLRRSPPRGRVLEQGGIVIVFPEGTRVEQPDALGSPHHGAGRLAVETGAPIVPVAILGTSHLWVGPVPKPRRMDVAYLSPVVATSATDAAELSIAASGRRSRTSTAVCARRRARLRPRSRRPGLGGVVAARSRAPAGPRLLGLVQPRRLRRRSRWRRWFERVGR